MKNSSKKNMISELPLAIFSLILMMSGISQKKECLTFGKVSKKKTLVIKKYDIDDFIFTPGGFKPIAKGIAQMCSEVVLYHMFDDITKTPENFSYIANILSGVCTANTLCLRKVVVTPVILTLILTSNCSIRRFKFVNCTFLKSVVFSGISPEKVLIFTDCTFKFNLKVYSNIGTVLANEGPQDRYVPPHRRLA